MVSDTVSARTQWPALLLRSFMAQTPIRIGRQYKDPLRDLCCQARSSAELDRRSPFCILQKHYRVRPFFQPFLSRAI